MYQTKTGRGRPRKRPYAAHNARAVKLRAENARRWLRELRWRIDAEPEVMRDLYIERKQDLAYLYGQGAIMIEVLDRIIRHLVDPVAPDEGQSDG